MRLVAMILLALGLATSVAAGAPTVRDDARCSPRPRRPAARSRSRTGAGTVTIGGKGVLVGRIEKGSLEILDLSSGDQWSPRVYGIPRGKAVTWRGKNVSFYIPGGRYRLTAKGTGISISARGTGWVSLDGDPDTVGETGTYAIGDDTRPTSGRRDEADVRSTARAEPAVVLIGNTSPMTAPQTVLVVEDETSIASFVALYLKNAGLRGQGRRHRAARR